MPRKTTDTPETADKPAETLFDNGAAAGTPATDAPAVPNAASGAVSADDAPAHTDTPAAPTTPASGPPNAPSAPASADADPADDADADPNAAPFLDLSKADEVAALIPRGVRVLVSCKACDPKLSASGNPMLNYRVTIERVISTPPDMPPIGDDVRMTWTKRTIFGRFMFTPPNPVTGSRGTMPQSQAAFKAFGVPWASRSFATRSEFMAWLAEVAPHFVGGVAEATIGIDTPDPTRPESYDPATNELYPDKNTVYGFREYRGAAPAPSTPAPRPPARNVPQAIENDEDLPF